jgi:hypothetical protein
VRQFNKATLLKLLRMYEGAICALEELRDPGVTDLLRRLELHSAEVVTALTAEKSAAGFVKPSY